MQHALDAMVVSNSATRYDIPEIMKQKVSLTKLLCSNPIIYCIILKHIARSKMKEMGGGAGNAIRIRANSERTTLFKSQVVQCSHVLLCPSFWMEVQWTESEVTFEGGVQ